jgi:hypothetical protein
MKRHAGGCHKAVPFDGGGWLRIDRTADTGIIDNVGHYSPRRHKRAGFFAKSYWPLICQHLSEPVRIRHPSFLRNGRHVHVNLTGGVELALLLDDLLAVRMASPPPEMHLSLEQAIVCGNVMV